MAETTTKASSKKPAKTVAKAAIKSEPKAAAKPVAKKAASAAKKPAAAPAAAKPAAKKSPVTMMVSDEQRYRMIAEAAYYRAESNHFKSDPVRDWIEAEKDIAALLNGHNAN